MKSLTVLSLFDGMSCAQIALNRSNIPIDTYFSSEIDKYAIAVTQHNYPETIQLGDITKWKTWNLPEIDLLIGGSPCQGFSFAGKGLNFDDPRSKLFFVFIDILKHYNPKYFLLENVRMKKEYEKVITEYVGVEPIMIDSALVSAQSRKRLYWTNIPDVKQPEDKKIYWNDIRETDAADTFYYSEKGLDWINRHSKRTGKKLRVWGDKEKCQMIEACHFKNYSSQRFFGINDTNGLRYITPLECERAQTVPDNFTLTPWKSRMMSNTQRYKMLGNGMTVDVIAHILSKILI